jgi:hypothetical protein
MKRLISGRIKQGDEVLLIPEASLFLLLLGGLSDCRISGLADWRIGGLADWRIGGLELADWRIGGYNGSLGGN